MYGQAENIIRQKWEVNASPLTETGEIEITWPKKETSRIFPIFLPHWGCPGRCVFCSQEAQTGQRASAGDLENILDACRSKIETTGGGGFPAFYGGSFTALPEPAWRKCLDFVKKLENEGLIDGFRCSARPDQLSDRRLAEAQEAGCKLIEFGAQSFRDSVLALSGRGCDGEASRKGLEFCRKAGMAFGVHLMPGLPGSSEDIFLEDASVALELNASCLRIHPCLVVRGTRLEKEWREGRYEPLNLEETLEITTRVWIMARDRGVSVIRIGVALESGFEDSILAGPVCKSMGSRVQGRALLKMVEREIGASREIVRIRLPRRISGFFFGKGGELVEPWRELGVDKSNIEFDGGETIRVSALHR